MKGRYGSNQAGGSEEELVETACVRLIRLLLGIVGEAPRYLGGAGIFGGECS